MNNAYRKSPQHKLWLDELIVDNFAGGGGASTGIEQALGRPVDIAINHDPDAIAMHTINHPHTKHYCESVWDINPREVTNGQPVGLAWFSPDCKHFSKAKGSTPVNKEIRGLAWVAVRWPLSLTPETQPRVIMLENVEEFVTWGPVANGRPCPNRKGQIFDGFKKALSCGIKPNHPAWFDCVHSLDIAFDLKAKLRLTKGFGYKVEHQNLVASDFGAPTIRKRFFLIARCDGKPIVWPTPTHGNPKRLDFKKSGLKKWKTAADIIDWSIPCPSIFNRKKPLAENTLRRIARGIERYVINNPKPFIVRIGQQGFGGTGMQYGADQPLTTITTKAEHCLVLPHITKYYGPKSETESRGGVLSDPIATQTTENRFGLVCAFLAKHFGGNYTGPGSSISDPLHTITAVDHNALVTTNLIHLRNNCDARGVDEPLPTLTAGGGHVGEVRAFLVKYYSTGGQWAELGKPLPTITAQDRLGLVTVHGQQYQIVDIGMRMLEPHELFAAQGFPRDYIIDRDATGNPIPKYKQVARCGNSVCPALAEALVRANYQSNQQSKVA